MKFSLPRLLSTAALITLTAIVVALIVRHAQHGFALYLGDVAWFTFLIGMLVTTSLAVSALVTHVLGRRHVRSSVR
jgi:hypothetical protein